MKIVQLTPQIGKNDLERKLRQAKEWLQDKEQVRIVLVLRGRQKGRSESALKFLTEIHENYLEPFGKLAKGPSEQNYSLTYNPR